MPEAFSAKVRLLMFAATFLTTQLLLCLLVIGVAAALAAIDMGVSQDYFRAFQDFSMEVFTIGTPPSTIAVLVYTFILVALSLRFGIVESLPKLLAFGFGLSVLVFFASKTVVDKVYPNFFDPWQAEVVIFSASVISGLAGAWGLWRTVIWQQRRKEHLAFQEEAMSKRAKGTTSDAS